MRSGRHVSPSKFVSETSASTTAASACTWKTSTGSSRVRLALIETSGSMRTRSDAFVELMSKMAFDPNPGTMNGTIIAVPTAATATTPGAPAGRRGQARPRPGARPHRAPPLHPPQRVGEDDRERRRQEHDAVDRLDELLEHGVGEREHGDGRQERQDRAAGAERERVAGEDRRPHREDRGEHEGFQRRRRRDLEAGLFADQMRGVEGVPQRVERRETVPRRPREDQEPDDHGERRGRHHRREQQVPPLQGGGDHRRGQGHPHEAPGRAVPPNTRPNANAVAIAMAQTAKSAISRCVRGDVPWGRAICPSSAWTGGG